MSALQLDASAPLGLAYACLLAALALWVWARARGGKRAFAVVHGLAWAAAVLLAVYVAMQAFMEQQVMFVNARGFLAVGALGVLLASRLGRADTDGDALSFTVALVALTRVLVWPPASSQGDPAQASLLYALAAGLRAFGAGALIAAAPGWFALAHQSSVEGREQAGLAAMGLSFALSSAWAWLNWGIFWWSDPRLNGMLAGWLLVLAGALAGNARGARVLKGLGLAVILIGALGGDWIARDWTHLPFAAW